MSRRTKDLFDQLVFDDFDEELLSEAQPSRFKGIAHGSRASKNYPQLPHYHDKEQEDTGADADVEEDTYDYFDLYESDQQSDSPSQSVFSDHHERYSSHRRGDTSTPRSPDTSMSDILEQLDNGGNKHRGIPDLPPRDSIFHLNHRQYLEDLNIIGSGVTSNKQILECMEQMIQEENDRILEQLESFVDEVRGSVAHNTFKIRFGRGKIYTTRRGGPLVQSR